MSDFILNDSVGEIASGFLTDLVKNTYKELVGWVGKKNKEFDILGLAVKTYNEEILSIHFQHKIIGMSRPILLQNLLIPPRTHEVNLSSGNENKSNFQAFENKDELVNNSNLVETIEGHKILESDDNFVILGNVGSGKSTLLKYLMLLQINNNNLVKKKYLPIFVQIKDWDRSNVDLFDYITKQFDICKFPNADLFIERVLSNGKCLILLDGFDEVSEEKRSQAIQEISDFTNKYRKNKFIISCRTIVYKNFFPNFSDIEIANFSNAQIEVFIKNWFAGDIEMSKNCYESIIGSEKLLDVARTPLLLTLLCIAFGRRRELSLNKTDIYVTAIETLLTDWDISRNIKRQTHNKLLTIKRKEALLSLIAFETFNEKQLIFTLSKVSGIIETYFENVNKFGDALYEEIDCKEILSQIEEQSGLIVQVSRNLYSFSHTSFHEYFTARYIVGNIDTIENLETIIREKMYDDTWRDVFTMIAEMFGNSSNFFLTMNNVISERVQEDEILIDLLRIGEDVIEYPEDNTPTLRFVSTFFLAFLALAFVPDENEEKSEAAERAQWLQSIGAFISKIMDCKLEYGGGMGINMQKSMEFVEKHRNSYHPEIALSFIIYFYLNMRLLECLNTESYCSKEIYNQIKQNLFRLENRNLN